MEAEAGRQRLGLAAWERVPTRTWTAWCGALAVVALVAGCGRAGRSDVGTAESCPHRDAYCPVSGAGVAWPGRPAESPSGRLLLRVVPVTSDAAGDDWRFEVVDKATVSSC